MGGGLGTGGGLETDATGGGTGSAITGAAGAMFGNVKTVLQKGH
jgi:hypothetical protein